MNLKSKTNYAMEYRFDFSESVFKDDTDLLEEITTIINESNIKYLDESLIGSKNREKIFNTIRDFCYIAIENHAKVKIKQITSAQRLFIELKSDEINFNNENIKEYLFNLIETTKTLNIINRDNGKVAMITEFDLSKK